VRLLCTILFGGILISSTSFLYGQTLGSGAATSDPNYILSPGDLVHIKVFQEDDLESELRVAKDGTVTFPLLGQIKLGGRTVGGAAQHLAERLRDGYLVSPQVSVTITSYQARRFVVLGQVQKPGAYEIPNEQNVSLLEAIGMAGGYTRIADPANVLVKRREAGVEKIIRLNAKRMAKDQAMQHFEVRPDDTITVPESLF
jgi:polysaccharide export outer membrane protein